MASVTLHGLCLSLASDLTQSLNVNIDSLTLSPVVKVTSATYAAGVFRMKRTPGRQSTARVAIPYCTDAEKTLLLTWQGTLLCFRDEKGTKFYGFYTDAAPVTLADGWSLTLTVQQVTRSEVA